MMRMSYVTAIWLGSTYTPGAGVYTGVLWSVLFGVWCTYISRGVDGAIISSNRENLMHTTYRYVYTDIPAQGKYLISPFLYIDGVK